MKNTWVVAVAGLTVAMVPVAKGDKIFIADANFQGVSGNMSTTVLVGTVTNTIGAWSAKLSDTLSLGANLGSGTSVSLNGPTPPVGNYELAADLPAGVGATASIWQNLTNNFRPNSTYALSVSLASKSALGLAANSSLNLKAGTNTLATVSVSNLTSLAQAQNNFGSVSLQYKTGNTVPTNRIGISLVMSSSASVGGTVYVDDFSLTVVPTQILLSAVFTNSGSAGAGLSIKAVGGAPNQQLKIITTSELWQPAVSWTALATNHFDTNGNFSLQLPVDPNTPYKFFRVVLP